MKPTRVNGSKRVGVGASIHGNGDVGEDVYKRQPLYRWDYHRQTGYQWWISRLEYCFRLYDVVRIDHFRGFDEYYSIPYGAENAMTGHWEKGPGIELFRRVEQVLGWKEIIAEDLGYVTDSVRQLVRESGFPGDVYKRQVLGR